MSVRRAALGNLRPVVIQTFNPSTNTDVSVKFTIECHLILPQDQFCQVSLSGRAGGTKVETAVALSREKAKLVGQNLSVPKLYRMESSVAPFKTLNFCSSANLGNRGLNRYNFYRALFQNIISLFFSIRTTLLQLINISYSKLSLFQ
jgi:hypothetical protein